MTKLRTPSTWWYNYPSVLFHEKGGESAAKLETQKSIQQDSERAAIPPAAVESTYVAGRRSRRLQRRLKPAVHAYRDTSRMALKHPDKFVESQIVGYHVTVLLDYVMKRALYQTRFELGDDVAHGLTRYLQRHIVEEQHHEEPGGMTLEDLSIVGINPALVRKELPPKQLIVLREYMTEQIVTKHPVAVLGFLQLEVYHSTPEGVEAMIEATGLPRTAFRNLELHAHVDVGHAAEIYRMIDTLPLARRHEELIYKTAVKTIKAVRASLLDVYK